ncbi:CocE/NonD family hydrolase [Ahrensia sp. R2A130]|uniref:CocE/NonD family hydrolase n=1 Tax=Ahrensia sp. R2A130 TaxID=744979 RepID=UPI0001E0A4DF|nr:CocE/NonD family hydrolase [Ahrensia sp. R2A130]EFL88236.1 glutaryl 7-ACA acylase [Ahrensia sp. R2A130]
MRIDTTFPRQITEDPDFGITMSDGVRLSARVWMPVDAEADPVPVILEHLPYRKRDGTIQRDQFSHPWMAGHGYCIIRTDQRGTGESEGLSEDEYSAQELADACEIIAWAAGQPWCNGNVGMQGISWGGFNSLQVAALRPPALKAIITICSSADRFADDIHTHGGCQLVENWGWASQMLSYNSRPPDPSLVGDDWQGIWRKRLDHEPWLWSTWMRHQTRDDYWKHGSVCEDYSTIEAAVLTIGGWHDGYRNTPAALVENLSAPVKAIIGPWNHKYPHYAGPKPAIGFLQEAKRWWDRWLKGENTSVENDPDMRLYLMDSMKPKRWYDERPGKWIAESEWPSQNISDHMMHLTPEGLSTTKGFCGLTVFSSQDCGAASGEFFPFAFSDELPDEQSGDDAKSICFDGAPVESETDIVGAPRMSLRLSADRPNALVAVRLCDLRPDGTSALITYGLFNLTHHTSHEHPEALVPGEIVNCEFLLDQIAYRLPAGHRLRVAISTSYWPFVWPSPEQAAVTIHDGRIAIPLRQSSDTKDEWAFEEPAGAPHWRTETLRESSYSRTTRTDATTGMVTTFINSDGGEVRDLEHGLISGSRVEERFTIHPDDPLCALASATWEQTGGREGAMWRTKVETAMWCEVDQFVSRAKLTAWCEDELFFEKSFDDTVPRNCV